MVNRIQGANTGAAKSTATNAEDDFFILRFPFWGLVSLPRQFCYLLLLIVTHELFLASVFY